MITSTSNPQMKKIIQLSKKAKLRNEEQTFIVEGVKMFQELPRELLKSVYVSESFLREEKNRKMLNGLAYESVSDPVFRTVSDTKTPQGILCLVRQLHYELSDLMKPKKPRLLLLEGLQDPGNLGTIMRTGEGAGISGIILNRESVDIYNPKVIRSTMGSIYRVPFIYVETLSEILPELKKKGITTYASHLQGTCDYDKKDYTSGCAFFVGNEGNGLSDELSGLADSLIRIPMEGKLESLNAAVAACILMYEASRQRR